LKLIPNSLFDKLNRFLREQSRWDNDNEDGGIHGHTLRHAFGGWLFTSLMLSDMERPAILFPDLDETNAWLRRGQYIRHALYGHSRPTEKHPFFVASLSAHAGFDTTAHSYIHLFPWLTAAFLDAAEEMAQAESLVKLACQAKDTTYRDWLNERGINGIPVQLMKSNCVDICIDSGNKASREVLPAPASSRISWAETIWNDLHRRGTNDLNLQPDTAHAAMFRRADYFASLTTPSGKYRHSMEVQTPGKRTPDGAIRIACPAKPVHERNDVSADLCSWIVQLQSKDPELVRDAVGIFVHHLEEREWGRFDSTADLAKANRYIAFLLALKLGPRQIQLVSGATKRDSYLRNEWKSKLAQPNLVIKLAGESRNYGAKTSLSIRPFIGSIGGIGTGQAGFRFIMAMTYIAFGADRSTQIG
jgi:hypothetical protein